MFFKTYPLHFVQIYTTHAGMIEPKRMGKIKAAMLTRYITLLPRFQSCRTKTFFLRRVRCGLTVEKLCSSLNHPIIGYRGD